MLPADELFSDGKLVPLQFSTAKKAPPSVNPPEEEVKSSEVENSSQSTANEDPYLFSPKAPRCSSRWRDFLGLKKLQGQPKMTSSSSANSKSIRYFLNRNSKTTTDTSSLTLPLLKDSSLSSSSSTDCDPVSISLSPISLSSTSSDHDELPRPSLTCEKPNSQPNRSGPKLQCVRPRENPRVGRSSVRNDRLTAKRNISVDSPRMNSSGKVVFHSLERSSSSPSSLNGGPRHNNINSYKNRGIMERSYSGNVHVRITPVLNVPVVCSLRGSSKSGVFGFSQLFSSSSQPQKKEGINNNNGVNHINSRSSHQKKEGNNNNGNNSISRNKKVKEK
uniref:Uncharacterized protein n=2 Tax=Chenopodium quinoa TaxID=63459 RepID=A0A803MUJ4_CHEQI